MRKILLFLVALAATLSMNAQTTEIYNGATKVATYSGADVTVSFGESSITVKQGTTVDLTYFGSNYKVVSKELPPSTGTAKRKPNVDVKWVQLWKDGPKFAECNIGANKATDCGYYLAWGGSSNQDATYNTGSAVLSGSDDSAYNVWGPNWRMPTNTDFSTLMSNCTCTWKTNYNGTGVNGLLCTGKGDYSSNSIFLPAAGYYSGSTGYYQGTYGNYWSSTPRDSGGAYTLFFSSGSQQSNGGNRNLGYSVRPIYVEDLVAVTGVSLNKTELKVGVGNTETLSATVTPADATNKKVLWTSSDETVATVDAYGKVKGVALGTCTITATTEDGGKTATCTVKVVEPTTGYAKATIDGKDVDVKWIQLWEGGPKFAEYNVGVTDGKSTSIGEYYAWNSTDIATSVWGSNWRMPTIAELQALLDNCYCAWYNSGSYLGCSGTGDYKTNTINLPKTGYKYPGAQPELQNTAYIYYWSSTPASSGYAKSLTGVPGLEQDFGPAWTDEPTGVEAKLCVRAVLKENEPK